MPLHKLLLRHFEPSSSLLHETKHICSLHSLYIQKRNVASPPQSQLLKQLQSGHSIRSGEEDTNNTQLGPTFTAEHAAELITRTLIVPRPFNRYHHLWLHKTLVNDKRIKNLPIPTPNYKRIPIVLCIMHHLVRNGPSTLENVWRGVRPLGVIKSKRRLKKTIKRYIEKYPRSLPFVNLNAVQTENKAPERDAETDTDNSDAETETDADSDCESGSESETSSPSDIEAHSELEFSIESDFSETDSAISTDWDSDGLQPSVYGIRPEKLEKFTAKYELKWKAVEDKIENAEILLYNENINAWWYSVHEHQKPVAKGPIAWDELVARSKTDKKNKGKLNKNKITNQTPVFNFACLGR